MRRPQGHPIVASIVDIAMASLERLRPRIVSQAAGRVLEIGAGTGKNFSYYTGVDRVDAVEPDPHMLKRALPRAEGLPFPVEVVRAGAEALC